MNKSEAVRRRPLALALLLALAVVLPGCGDGDNDNGNDVFEDSRAVGVLDAFVLSFTANRNGTVDANVNWNNSGNDIDIYTTAGNCNDFASVLNGNCNVVAFSESGTAKPEVLSFSATQNTTYRVWAFNLGPNTDTVTIRLTAR